MSDIRAICNLSEADFEARRKEIRERLVPSIRAREELCDGLALLFDSTPALREELEAFVDLERECCPGLGFALGESASGLRLEIRGIDPGAPAFAGLGEARKPEVPLQRRWQRVLRSLALGAIGSFVLFCVVPIGLAAALGAAPLAALDDPRIVAIGAIALALLFWRWERRREAARAQAGDCGC